MLRKAKDLGFGNRLVGENRDRYDYKNHLMRVKKARRSDTLNSFFMNTTTNYFNDTEGEGRHTISVGAGGGGATFKPNITKKDSSWNKTSLCF